MSTISLRLPESLHAAAKDLAEQEDVSLNQLIATALAEKLSALAAEDMVLERARRGDRQKFLAALDKSPDVLDENEPKEYPMSVNYLLETKSPTVQSCVRQVMTHTMGPGVEAYTTNTNGGDLRFRNENGIFAEIKFFKRNDQIDLRLYFPPDYEPGEHYRLFERKTNMQAKYDRRLNAQEPIPDDVVRNISKSLEFMNRKRG